MKQFEEVEKLIDQHKKICGVRFKYLEEKVTYNTTVHKKLNDLIQSHAENKAEIKEIKNDIGWIKKIGYAMFLILASTAGLDIFSVFKELFK